MENLFKKAAVMTDIHFGLRSNSIQHNVDCLNFVEWFIEQSKNEGCETCFFLGDWNHHRASINIQTLHYSLKCLELLNDNFERVFFVVGNHDLFYRNKRDTHSVEWAKHLPNVVLITDWFEEGNVVISPWLVEDEWKKLLKKRGRYLFGHFELPKFLMNSFVEMPDHGELQVSHLSGFEQVFSGHFHKRQTQNNVTYIGNAFPHNFSDVDDVDRGMMILDWGGTPQFRSWPQQPLFKIYNLSEIIEEPQQFLGANMHVKINVDIPLSYEEASTIKNTFISQYDLREMQLIPVKADIESDVTDYTDLKFESVDAIIQNQINELEDGHFDKKLLLEIYKNL